MESLLLFVLTIIFISVLTIRYHITPFLTLIAAAFLFGTFSGMDWLIQYVTGGAGRIFSLLGIPIYCGAVIAQLLRHGHFIEKIVEDVKRTIKAPDMAAGVVGYFLSIPLMCCLTTYVVMLPLIEQMEKEQSTGGRLFYMAAFGSVLSFVLILPLPVVYSMTTAFGVSNSDTFSINFITVPLSLFLLGIGYVVAKRLSGGSQHPLPELSGLVEPAMLELPRWKVWLPIALPIILISIGYLFSPLSIISDVNIALVISVFVSLLLVDEKPRKIALEKGTKNAGIILFDLCGAGALGFVIAASSFPDDVFALINGVFPVVVIPFVLAVLIQTAQGSRIVTAVITSTIVAGTDIVTSVPIVPLILMISAGTLIISYVSDPYFWLIQRSTGDSIPTVVRRFTLPLAGAGVLIFCCAMVLFMFA
jgi:GntP family gluconate:H+ symporter